MRTRHIIFTFFLLLSSHAFSANDGIWLLVDTQKLKLDVKLGNVTLVSFDNISIGRNGSGFKHKLGDDITPKGKYKISWTNRRSRYHVFYGFNYPSRENAQQALKQGLIDKKTYSSVINAHNNNRVPPQNTPLGGLIGIHGLGRGDKNIHKTMNWTHGCIALTNEQINKLDTWIKNDTIVVVK